MRRKLRINKNLIKAETDGAIKIALPHNSEYDGFHFWHSSKLVKQEGKSLYIIYTESFVFKLQKYGKGKHNRGVIIDEIPLAYDELEAVFNDK